MFALSKFDPNNWQIGPHYVKQFMWQDILYLFFSCGRIFFTYCASRENYLAFILQCIEVAKPARYRQGSNLKCWGQPWRGRNFHNSFIINIIIILQEYHQMHITEIRSGQIFNNLLLQNIHCFFNLSKVGFARYSESFSFDLMSSST